MRLGTLVAAYVVEALPYMAMCAPGGGVRVFCLLEVCLLVPCVSWVSVFMARERALWLLVAQC